MHIHQDRLLPNEYLEADELLLSPNGRYTFVYQGDGNLVLYKFRPDGSRNPLWDSRTNGRPVGRCIMQGDGNLVVYGSTGDYVWDSGTDGKNDSWLVIQDDGNAVIYLPNGTPIWTTNTVQPAMGKVTDEELKNWPENRRTAVAGHCYPEHLDELVAIVQEAERQGRCVRAVGSKWSASDVAMTPDYVVETDQLAGIVTDVLEASPAILIPSASHLNLVHVEAGIKLVDLNRYLDGKDLAMPVLGGSSGQSLAGALSTSVHGADFELGPLPDIVRAIHLVGPGGIQYWIEPTAGITDRDRLSALLSIPKENIRHDDAWFNSVLVSMGALGIIYSVIIEVRPQYNLIANCEHLIWDTMRARLRAGTAFAGKRAVQVVVSQFKHDDGTRPCFLTTRTESVKTSPFVGGLPADLTRILAGLSIELLNVAPQAYPAIVKGALFQSLNAGTTEGWAHTIMCSPPPPPAIGLGLEFAFDANNDAYLDFVDAALELLDTAYQNEALGLGGWLSLRFVGHSRAYLSPQHASTRTCMVEFTGAAALKSTKPLLTRLETKGRAHGGIQHWGMFDDLQASDVARAYPELDRWRQVRWELTKGGMLGTFDNAFTNRCGLSQAPGVNIQLWHNEQTANGVSAPWTDWHELAKPANKAKMLALTAHPDGRMHAVMTGLDGQIWHSEQTAVGATAPWTDWHALSNPGNKAKALSLAAHPDGRMHAVMAGLDDQLWHNEQMAVGVSAPWTDWHALSNPGNKAKALSLAAHPDGRMHAVMAGLDDQLWHNEQTAVGVSAPWTDWHALSNPGNKAKTLALAAHPDGRMHAVMAGLDDQLWHNEQTAVGVSAPWTDWHALSNPGNKAKALALAAHPDGRMHAVMAGLDDQLWHNEQTAVGVSAPWTDWHELSHPGNKAKTLALAAHPDGRMHAVMTGLDDQVWHNEQTAVGVSALWTDWHELSHPGNKAKRLVLAVHPDGRTHAVMVGW